MTAGNHNGRNDPDSRYGPADEVTWAVTGNGILAVHRLSGLSLDLPYPPAALWDCLCRGGTLGQAMTLTALVAGVDAPDARTLARRCLKDWLEEGWLWPQGKEG
jgi:hypothetical protein